MKEGHEGDLDVDGRIILEIISKTKSVKCEIILDMVQWDFCKQVKTILFSYEVEKSCLLLQNLY